MNWTFSVAACRYDGTTARTTSYVVEGDAYNARTAGEADARGLEKRATHAFRELGKSDAIVEAGRVNSEEYLLVLRRGAVLHHDESSWSAAPGAPVVLGPSAALALAEEWNLSGEQAIPPFLSLNTAAASPYLPHRSPLGGAPLRAIAAEPFRWSRPFAALDADRNAVLALSASRMADAPRALAFVESLVPLVAGGNTMEWLASISGQVVTRIRISVATLLAAVTGALGEPEPGLIDDPVAGERYGYAPPLATSLTLRELMENAA
ncbi:MAG TPA: hypothetical protein VFO89_16905 [Thermoanaerobaculia bacterium]|nr:hypothetical protein [Thermoanaerobaculia bacterium]